MGWHSEQLNFVGDVRLHATVSQMVGGSKGWLLAPFDPIFRSTAPAPSYRWR